ncbi:hypothetical protein PIB30_016551 [Stylosanthes scabra]|uniref:Uncharacterized protein n=1 Tax=Stylosanthes scabra TaxID=79078 RepID=A0ABU6R7Q0_9FABA|nr:hypothetical protein [Stylosanthes scabra]
MEDLSMFQRPRTVALEDENPGTYGTVLIYPLNRLVECGFVGDTAVNPWVGIFCRRQGFARESPLPVTVTLVSNRPIGFVQGDESRAIYVATVSSRCERRARSRIRGHHWQVVTIPSGRKGKCRGYDSY